MNFLFVCTGNTCRSPMAEVLFNQLVDTHNINAHAKSAGIFANEGDCASDEAIEVSKEYQADLTNHKAKNITEDLIVQSDVILTMTESHKQLLSPIASDKVFTINEYVGLNGDISDPYGGTIEEYRYTTNQIHQLLLLILEKISK